MADNIEEIRNAAAKVRHPAINCSLVDLVIVKSIEVKNENVIITMASPFPNIPIKDYLVDSMRKSIEKIDTPVEIENIVMTREGLQKFLALEKEICQWRES